MLTALDDSKLSCAERVAIQRVDRQIVIDLAELMTDAVGTLRGVGLDDDEIRELLVGHAHDHRHLSEVMYFVRRGVIRMCLQADRDGLERAD
jgi:hypothetical protein